MLVRATIEPIKIKNAGSTIVEKQASLLAPIPSKLLAVSIAPINAKNFDKPVLGLTLDEHTGEAGFVTRIEAFIDMLSRKKRIKKAHAPQKKEDALKERAVLKKPNFDNIPLA